MLERYERRKLFRFWFILLITPVYLAALIIWSISTQETLDSYGETVYRGYISRWKGVLSEQARVEIETEKEKIEQIEEAYIKAQHDYLAGNITRDEFHIIAERYDYVMQHKDAFSRIYETYQYLMSRDVLSFSGESEFNDQVSLAAPEFFQDTAWIAYYDMPPVGLLLIVLFFGMALPYYYREHECSMWPLLLSAAESITVLRLKRRYTLILAISMTLFSGLVELFILALIADADTWRVPVQSLPYFKDCYLPISLWKAFAGHCIVRAIGFSLLSLLCGRLSEKVKNPITVLIIVTGILAVPAVMENIFPIWSYSFLWHNLVLGTPAIREQLPWSPIMLIAIPVAVLIVEFLALWKYNELLPPSYYHRKQH